MKNKKEKELKENQNEINIKTSDEIRKAKNKKKRAITIIVIILILIIVAIVMTYDYLYGNEKYITADITIQSSSKVYLNTEPSDEEDIGDGALFIFYINGIKMDKFLETFEVTQININGEDIALSDVTYRHLNNALSIRMHCNNYETEKGNVVKITIRNKSSNQIINKRLYHTTEVV